MHIGIVLSTPLPPREGIGFYTWNLAKQLKQNGHEITMITRGGRKQAAYEEIDGISIFRPTFFPLYPFHVHIHGFFVNHLLKQLQGSIDILHFHSPLVGYPKTSVAGLVTFHTTMKANTRAQTRKTFLEFLTRFQTYFSLMLEKDLISKAKMITTVATSVAEELTAYNVDPRSVFVLGNAVNTLLFCPEQDHESDPNPGNYFLTVGRLAPRKGLEDLLVCAKIVCEREPSLQFWIAGSGPYEKQLRALALSLGVEDNVRFLGHIDDRQRLVSLYRGAIGYLHPAHYEGLPTVILEAMACGQAVISTAVSGALDVIDDGVNGLLVPPHNPNELSKKVFQILYNPDFKNDLGKAAAVTIQQKYTWHYVANNFEQLYASLITMDR